MNLAVSTVTAAQVKQLVDVGLDAHCKSRLQDAGHVNERYVVLWQAINTLLQAGGKRFRPYMLIMSYVAYCQDTEAGIDAIVPAALAQELIHQAMLIHDDIIDRDTVRYGIKNITGQYDELYTAHLSDASERLHMSESSALLAGDALLSDAYRLLSQVQCEQQRVARATMVLSEAVFEVIAGELLDTENSFIANSGISAETIARYKTASYSFASPLTIGAILAGTPEEEISLLREFSRYVGLGFQLRDDLLGIFGDEAVFGKSTSTDIIEGKRTYLIEQFELCADEAQKAEFLQLFHRADASQEEINRCRELLDISGARSHVESKIGELRAEAERVIDQLDIESQHKDAFINLVHICLSREK